VFEGRPNTKRVTVRISLSVLKSQHGERLRIRSEKRVVKRAISNLFVKVKGMDTKIANLRLQLKQDFGFSKNWVQRMENWVLKSLGKLRAEVRSRLLKKLKVLRDTRLHERKKVKTSPTFRSDKKVVYNNSSKQFTTEQLELLSLGLNFGIAPKRFPIVEYVTATEVLCQKLEEIGDDESMEKARKIRNEVFLHLKRGYKLRLRSNSSFEERIQVKIEEQLDSGAEKGSE